MLALPEHASLATHKIRSYSDSSLVFFVCLFFALVGIGSLYMNLSLGLIIDLSHDFR